MLSTSCHVGVESVTIIYAKDTVQNKIANDNGRGGGGPKSQRNSWKLLER
jgi:hypothetical protein